VFTGIVESIGTIKGIRPYKMGLELEIDSDLDLERDHAGDSIAVDGVCLTATYIKGKVFRAVVSAESLSVSTLGLLKIGSKVNIERSLALSDRLGGHIMLGHVDTVGRIAEKKGIGESTRITVAFESKFGRYVIEKGSIAIDGISLTINRIQGNSIEANIIPHTAVSTSLTLKSPGDSVNIEFDVLGKYVERLFSPERNKGLEDLLKRQGII